MINEKEKLNPKIFDDDVQQESIRQGYGEGLLQAGDEDERVVALCADLTDSTKTNLFANKYPERFIQAGIAEQSMASIASGMASMGKIPFVTSYAMFNPGRNWEQIRTTICYNNQPVKIVGSHAGVSVGADGGTHQAIEDIAITRVIPRLVVISPCDSIEARKATVAAARSDSPVYIRLAREKSPVITTEETPFELGKARLFFKANKAVADVSLIATGALVYKALRVAAQLENEGLGVNVLNLATIKPIDKETILWTAKESNAVVTIEEHQINGGMGSAVAEIFAKNYPTPIEFVGIDDKFGQSGTPNELIEHYGMGEESIYKAAHKVISRKYHQKQKAR